MATTAPSQPTSKRGLLIHDTLFFLALLAISIALFGVTLFLFRSFQSHRADLAVRWSSRGRIALQQNRAEEAVSALRIALNYSPDGRDDQLLLAEALARAGHREEATNYFLTLWDNRPGDGFINLQLARLARKRGDKTAAEDYYRASIYGSWEGDAILQRRQGRLELVDFLIVLHKNAEARNELFTIAGNAPSDMTLNETVAQRLALAGYLPDALTFYEKAAAAAPRERQPLTLAGRAAYALGEYATAARLLDRAGDLKPGPGESDGDLAELTENARRIQQLALTRDQPAHDRANHILTASKIAQDRLRACVTNVGLSPADASVISSLNASWTTAMAGSRVNRRALLENAAAQDTWTQLVFQTEQQTAQVCGEPTGDDALLLRLANTSSGASASGGKDQLQNGK
jgi:tetratricopeptide (TPR) repeat protein